MQKLRQATSQEVREYADYVRKLEDYETMWDWVDLFEDSDRVTEVRFTVEVNNDDEEMIFLTEPVFVDLDGNEQPMDDSFTGDMPNISDDGKRDLNYNGNGEAVFKRKDFPQLGKIKPLWIIEDDKSA